MFMYLAYTLIHFLVIVHNCYTSGPLVGVTVTVLVLPAAWLVDLSETLVLNELPRHIVYSNIVHVLHEHWFLRFNY